MLIDRRPDCVFLCLEAARSRGGIQRFNSRIIAALRDISGGLGVRPVTLVLKDEVSSWKDHEEVAAFNGSRIQLARDLVARAAGLRTILVSHINLLPLALLAKVRNPRINVILFAHGIEVWNEACGRKRRAYEPLMLKFTSKIASVSRYTRDVMSAQFRVPRDKFEIFPNVVDAEPSEPQRERDSSRSALVVTRLTAGEERKNVDVVIRAFAETTSAYPDARLTIIGKGGLRPGLERLAVALGVESKVVFLGEVSDRTLSDAYRDAAVFVLPSAKEGFGIVYLEAWSKGVPVICSSSGASSEIVEDGIDGWVVPPRNVASLTKALTAAFADPAKSRQMGESGRQKVHASYSSDVLRSNLRSLLLVHRVRKLTA